MDLQALQNDPYFMKFIMGLARMLGEYMQEKAASMSAEELYNASMFFPSYNEDRDYSEKTDGYTCRKEDGTIMQLVTAASTGIATMDENDGHPQMRWKCVWSKDPMMAKPYMGDDASPYYTGDCCIWEGEIYRCLVDGNFSDPEDEPDRWEKVGV